MHATLPHVQDAHEAIASALSDMGISLCAGVTGGGLFHFSRHLPPYPGPDGHGMSFFTVAEYAAGFVPLGYHLASGRVAAAAATTGAATKLLTCGMTDAKFHNIPALYIVPLSPAVATGFSPLQDSTALGANTLAQLQAELPGAVFVVDDAESLAEQIDNVRHVLAHGRPAVLALDPVSLGSGTAVAPIHCPAAQIAPVARLDIAWPLERLTDRKIVVQVGAGLPATAASRALVKALATRLGAAVTYSINGANGVDRDDPYLYGYLGFGGNDVAREVWRRMDDTVLLLALGVDFDEYTTGLGPVTCGEAWLLGGGAGEYGTVNGSRRHQIDGTCREFHGQADTLLRNLVEALDRRPVQTRRFPPAPPDLNTLPLPPARPGYVDLGNFYRRIDTLWRPGSIGFDDVCMAYKDRQYVTQRPNPHCPFFSLYRGSAMGGAFGLGVGARLGAPEKTTFVFTGDGCFRLFAGNMGEARDLGLNVFVLDNRIYGIVRHGARKLLPNQPQTHYHDELGALDYPSIASGFGWDCAHIDADLGNLEAVMARCYQPAARSQLIVLSVDPEQDLGPNPRLNNL